jgi:hypothetical protein
MKILTTTTFGRPVSFNCALISRVEEYISDNQKTYIYNGNEMIGTIVDMPYLEVVGFLKAIE